MDEKAVELPGSDPVIEHYKQFVDRTLIRENLRLTPTERLEKLAALQQFAEELRRAGRESVDDWSIGPATG
jgi:hypothetical protein